MSVQELIDILNDLPDKDLPVVMPVDFGFVSVCAANSTIAESDNGEKVFVLLPCNCHDKETISNVTSDEFEIFQN